MGLIVPKDSRQPQMGCIDHEEREIVLFENGSLGYRGSDDDSDLRGGSSYVLIINELSDLKSPPNFSPSKLDWPSMKRKYVQAQIIIYGLILILISLPIVKSDSTYWTVMISSWTGLDFNGWLRYVLGFIAIFLGVMPEIIVGSSLGKRENQSILTLDTKHGLTEIIVSDAPKVIQKPPEIGDTSSKNIILITIILLKIVLLPLIFIDFIYALTIVTLVPLVILVLVVIRIYTKLRRLGGDEIEIPEAELSKIFAYMEKRWGTTQLRYIISAGESRRMEFKSSLWYDYDKADPNNKNRYDPDYNPSDKRAKNERAKSVIKAVVGFLNSNVSGRLLIGVGDDGQILGLESDFELLNVPPSKQRDVFERKLDTLLNVNMSSNASISELWDFSWLEQEEDGRWVCMLTIRNSPRAVYHKVEGKETYYIRRPSSTEPIPPGIELSKELNKFPR